MSKLVYKFDDDISTDIIYPGRFMATVLPSETPQFAFADLKELNKKLNDGEIPKGSIMGAGKNFGCGSSREQAVSTLKGYELTIIAKNFARIFFQNSVNLGLQTIVCPEFEADEGDNIELKDGKVLNITKNKEFETIPHSKARQEIIDAGGLIAYTRNRLLSK